MKNTPKNSFRNIISASQSTAIVLLFASLIFMFAQYCILSNTNSPSSLPKLSEKDGGVFFAPTEAETSTYLIAPVIAGFCDGESFVSPSVHNGDYERFLRLSAPFFKAAFSDISTLLDFSSESARADYVRELIQDRSFLYFHFGYDLPAAAFFPSYTGDAQEDIFHSFNLRELYILLDGSGNLSGVARDSRGNIATLSVQDKVTLSFDSFMEFLNSTASGKLEFVSVLGVRVPAFSNSVTTSKLFEYNTTGDFTEDNGEGVENALSAFGFNPNGTKIYKSSDGRLTYVQEQGELSVTTTGDITYTPSGNGMPLSEFLDRERSIYSFSEKICSAYKIINSLDRKNYGRDASLCLSSVSYTDGELTLEFSYQVSGIPVDSTPAARFVFSDSSLVSASVTRRAFSRLTNTSSDIPQKLLLAIYAQDPDKEHGALIPLYTTEKKVENGTIFSSKYAFVTPSGNETRRGAR